MLDMMQIQSTRFWPTLANLDSKIDVDVIIPQTVLNNVEYQNKLQRLAMYSEQGDHRAMQSVLDNGAIMTKKNLLLQPLFRDLKSQIRHMSYTNEFSLIQEYLTQRKELEKAMVGEGADKTAEVVRQLENSYADLLRIQNNDFVNDPKVRLMTLRERLENILELLNCWQQYVDVIYMSEMETNYMEKVAQDEDVSTSRMTFKKRQEE